jgi:hypothetical protein
MQQKMTDAQRTFIRRNPTVGYETPKTRKMAKIFPKPVDRPTMAMIARFDEEAERSFRESFERLLPDHIPEKRSMNLADLMTMPGDEFSDAELDMALRHLEPTRATTRSS